MGKQGSGGSTLWEFVGEPQVVEWQGVPLQSQHLAADSGRENKVFFACLPVDAGMVVVGEQWLCVHACVQMKPQSTKYPKEKVSKNQSRGQKQDMR